MPLAAIEQAYYYAAGTKSDMNEHCPTLLGLARQCKHVTEFGLRDGVSTTALLLGVLEAEGGPGDLLSYDEEECLATRERLTVLGGRHFYFVLGNSLKIPQIMPTDLLMIDTVHTGWHIRKELDLHAPAVRKYIAMHDTETYGKRGDDGGEGMWPAVCSFLRDSKEGKRWFIKEHHANCHGLTVLERQSNDRLSFLELEGATR